MNHDKSQFNTVHSPLWNPLHSNLRSPFSGSAIAGGGGGSGELDPLTLFDGGAKGFWLNFRDRGTLYQESGAVNLVSTDGQTIGNAVDQSEHNIAFTATESYAPRSETVSGVVCADFTGSDYLGTSFNDSRSSSMDCFLLIRYDSDSNQIVLSDGGAVRFFGYSSDGNSLQATYSLGPSTYRVNGVQLSGSPNTTADTYRDAVYARLNEWIVVEILNIDMSSPLIETHKLGGTTGFYFQGQIAEMILVDSKSDEVRDQIRQYMAAAGGVIL